MEKGKILVIIPIVLLITTFTGCIDDIDIGDSDHHLVHATFTNEK